MSVSQSILYLSYRTLDHVRRHPSVTPLSQSSRFLNNSEEQIRAQMDAGVSMVKFQWTWYSFPRPNFGVFLVKSHPHSIKVLRSCDMGMGRGM